jgi:protein-S-isoprenylcysteine O-methyltransferase Ste14
MNAQRSFQREALTPEIAQGVKRWQRKQISFLVMLLFILFLPAGTLNWSLGWVQWGAYVLVTVAQMIILVPRSPALLAERSKVQKGAKGSDIIVLSLAAGILPIVAWIIAGLDFRNGWTVPMSPVVVAAGLVVWLVGYGITIWSMAANPFFSPVVRIQNERGQQVVASGPYAIVRHPGYLGAIIFQLATPFLLSSWPSMIPCLLAAVFYVLRIVLEERTLREGLPGYAEYTNNVRFRLLPGVW